MTLEPRDLYKSPNALADHYGAFRVADRLLLTGHSHQAWPDAGFEGQKQAWLDAAEHVDAKWDRVGEQVDRVSEGYRELMGGCDGVMTLDNNTHALVVRLLSAMPLRERPRIVTTDGEFHSIRRQLARLEEEGIQVVRVPTDPIDSLSARVADAVDDRTSCAMISSVLFSTGLIVPDLASVAAACEHTGARMLVDAYHSLNVVPFSLDGLEQAFVVGGGYKYCQLGEGVCFLRVPPECDLRPVITGWFSEFAELAEEKNVDRVRYGAGGARFAGSTFDPTSSYRAAAVFDFFDEQGLGVDLLREVSQHQVGLLSDVFQGLDLDPAVVRLDDTIDRRSRAGFLALQSREAAALASGLQVRGVLTDFRADRLRFGPAPYLSDGQLVAAMEALGEVVRNSG